VVAADDGNATLDGDLDAGRGALAVELAGGRPQRVSPSDCRTLAEDPGGFLDRPSTSIGEPSRVP